MPFVLRIILDSCLPGGILEIAKSGVEHKHGNLFAFQNFYGNILRYI